MNYEKTNRPYLIVQHTGQVFPLSTQVVTLGTAEDNSIVLADPEVSAHHTRIFWDSPSGAFFVEDLGSVEGTYVNERSIIGPHRLREGDEIRLGNTVLEVTLGAATGMAPEPRQSGPKNAWLVGLVIALLAMATILCIVVFSLLFWAGRGKEPNVIIQSPTDGARIPFAGSVTLQVTASGASDITLLEVSIDGILFGTLSSQDPSGTSLLTLNKSWTFDTPGEHTISAEAFTAGGEVGEARPVQVTALPAAQATPTPEMTATFTPTPEPTATFTPTLEPPTSTPTPTVPPPPQIEYFQASPASITIGNCTTLQWGKVNFATEAVIEPDIGGVATPGSREVCPRETMNYVLTAVGPGGTTTASTTVTVIGYLADLTVDSISFEPSPPVQGQETLVRITIRNAGQGAALPFDWGWQAGSEALFDGRVNGLNPGETTVALVAWIPQHASSSLTTEARVDTRNEVIESDEANNLLAAMIQVVEAPPPPQTVELTSEAALDGYRTNNGTGSISEEILVGNGGISDYGTELVARGFFSFDTSSIPPGATIESVRLDFYQQMIQGDPYQTLGNLVLDHVDYGLSLDDSAYDTPAFHSAVLAQMTSPNSWYTLADPTLTLWLKANLAAGRSRFQLRLRFVQETDGDGEQDLIPIEPGEGFRGNPPRLTVVYHP